jgi:ornithine carbamoyltransferase
MSGSPRHLLDIADVTAAELRTMLDLAAVQPSELTSPLVGQGVVLLFEKPSNRTRQSMELAVFQLGGHPVYTRAEEVGIDVREPADDVVRILAGYHAVIAARVFDHLLLERMAAVSGVPVVNMLSDHSHPLQALADALTMETELGPLAGRRVAWVGDYNNVARSLGEACALLGAHIAYACPVGFGPADEELERLALLAGDGLGDATVSFHHHAAEAVAGADAVHADTWVSMGQEEEKASRIRAFEGFTVDQALLDQAAPGAVFMHCMPAYRGLEVTADVIDGPRSRVFQQGHNRLPAARGALAFLMGVRP